MKKILLNILTHGTELVGKRVADEISRLYPNILNRNLYIQIANEEAYKAGKRYIEQDLNRVFPGNKEGSYEEKLAYSLKKKVEEYDLVIDIHSTESGSKDMIIVTKLDAATKTILNQISPRYVLFMNIKNQGSLISSSRIGIALEMGSEKDEETYTKSLKSVEAILGKLELIESNKNLGFRTRYFEVFAEIAKEKDARLEPQIENFSLVKQGDTYAKNLGGKVFKAETDFYPVIFGNDNYEKIFGFAARELK